MATSKIVLCVLLLLVCSIATERQLRKAHRTLSSNKHIASELLQQNEIPQEQVEAQPETTQAQEPQVEEASNNEVETQAESIPQESQTEEQVQSNENSANEEQTQEQSVEQQPQQEAQQTVENQPQEEVQAQPQEVEAQPEQTEAQPQEEVQAQPQEEVQAQPQEEAQAQPQEEVQAQPQEEVQAQPQETQAQPQESKEEQLKDLNSVDDDLGKNAVVYLVSDGGLKKIGHEGDKDFQLLEQKILREAILADRVIDMANLPKVETQAEIEAEKEEELKQEEVKKEQENLVVGTDDMSVSVPVPAASNEGQAQEETKKEVVEEVTETLKINVHHEDPVLFLTTFDDLTDLYEELNQKPVSQEQLESSDCIYLFSECNYKGSNMKSCSKNPSKLSSFPLNIASIYVPPKSSISFVHDGPIDQYTEAFTDSVACLDQPFSFAVDPAHIEISFKDGSHFED